MDIEKYEFWIYGIFFILMLGASLLLNTILLRFSKNLGTRENDGSLIRWSNVTKPSLGGIGFYLIFLLSIGAYGFMFDANELFGNTEALGIVCISTLAFFMGLADDAYNTKPLLKFGVQILCGAILILTDNYIQTFPYEWLNYTMTILWVIGIMNSINMLDNMDGITSTTSVFILLIMLGYMQMMSLSSSYEFILMLGVLASLVGFLFYNWHPSKMFMGDTGSQFLGVFLAALSIKFLWNSKGLDGSIIQSRQIALVLLSFMLPIIDTTVVSINRIRRGQSPFVGGKDHTTHNLSYLGLSDSQVGFVFAGVAAICAFAAACIIRFLEDWNHIYTAVIIVFVILILAICFYITYLNKDKIRSQ